MAAPRYIEIRSPDGGWGGENSDWPADLLAPGQLSATESVYHDGTEIVRRGGQFREPNAQVSAGRNAVINSGYAARFTAGQKIIVQDLSAGLSVGRFWQTSAGMTTWVAMGTSSYRPFCNFAQLGDIVAITTDGGTMLGASGTDDLFSLASSAPSSQFIITYKNRFFAVSADSVYWTAVGATTGLPTPTDWLTANNAGFRVFSQGEGNQLIGLAKDHDQWYAFKRNYTAMVTGATPQSFVTVDADREWGAHHRTIANVGRGLIGANEDGICSLINGKVEPLLPDRMLRWWQSIDLSGLSSWSAAWSPYYQQYRLMVLSGGVPSMLIGTVLPNRPISWYRWAVPAYCVFTRFNTNNRMDFYRGGSGDGYLYRMDQGTLDASASYVSYFETGIYDGGKPWQDKQFKRAWVYGRTRGEMAVSCTFRIHGESAKPTAITGYRTVSLSTSAGDVKRASFHLDGTRGWGCSVRVDFSNVSAGSIHKIILEYTEQETGKPPIA